MADNCEYTAPDGSLIALVDCDTFYASCERVCRPDLIGKPIVVLSNNDGCLVAMSREAKKLGLPMGEPEYQVRHLLRKHNVAVFSSNYTLYGDLSHRVMQTIESVASDLEIYSIDEAFVRLRKALAANADAVVREIRRRVLQWVGLPVSIGVGPTKVLAKIATRVAKKYPVYGGIFDLSRCTRLDELLDRVVVKDLWGIGRKGALKLKSNGIFTARQLRDADSSFIRRLLTVTGFNLQMELRGIPAIREEIPMTHTTIISSRSLGYKVTEFDVISQAIAFHAARAAEKLRAKKLLARQVSVRIQTAIHRPEMPQHDEMIMVQLRRPVCDSGGIIKAARAGLERIFKYGHAYAKAMVMLTELSDPSKGQGELMGPVPNEEKRAALMQVMDRINRVEGRGTLVFASQGRKDADWHMKRENLSPAWTTDFHNLLKVWGEPGHFLKQE